jgi:hypothetical protein
MVFTRARVHVSHPLRSLACALPFVLGVSWNACSCQEDKPLCIQDTNKFHTFSHTQVEVTVAPPQSGGFGQHECRADLKWGNGSLLVADSAAEVDLDLFEVDLEGLGPVAAFQVKESAAQCCSDYRIYSLTTPVRLVRTLHGGHFLGADTDLDGRVEIWAEDRAAIDGLDGLTQVEIKYPPTYVLRFEQGRLLDASSDFEDHFDHVVAKVRGAMTPEDLRAFLLSDGKLELSADKVEQWRKLRATKVQVLEIVWAYLYTGRESQAWKALHAMWPAADVPRIQGLIVKARSAGIATQIDGVSNPTASRTKPMVSEDPPTTPSTKITQIDTSVQPKHAQIFPKEEVTPAAPIYMWRPQPSDPNGRAVPDEDEWVDLIIDSAGKVRSVKWTNRGMPRDQVLMAYAFLWKFIPALRHGHSVASELRFAVFLKR